MVVHRILSCKDLLQLFTLFYFMLVFFSLDAWPFVNQNC